MRRSFWAAPARAAPRDAPTNRPTRPTPTPNPGRAPARSVTAVGRCAFVQVGVIGECNRDGFRQSRLLRVTAGGYQVLTVDHGDNGRTRLDLQQVGRSLLGFRV